MSHNSSVFVYYGDGKPYSGVRVALGFTRGGFTKEVYTDSNGMANIDHASSGEATVYVRGNSCGTFYAPGRTSVTCLS